MRNNNKPVAFNRKSAERIARTVKHFEGRGRGEAPPPRRARHVGGGGGAATLAVQVTTAIPVASQDAQGRLTRGTATVRKMKVDADGYWVPSTSSADDLEIENGLPDPITAPGAGKYKVGYVTKILGSQVLIQCSCATLNIIQP